MKLALFVLLVSFALANAFFFRVPGSVETISDDDNLGCIEGYFTSFYAHFGLKKPEQVLNCFDKKSAKLYFEHIAAVSTLVQDAENRNRIKVHLDFAKLGLIGKALEHVNVCVAHTQDTEDLLKALDVKTRNPDFIGLASFIHYQAEFGKLANDVPKVVGALDSKDFAKAGDLAAAILKDTVSEIHSKGLALLALKGLWNGVNIALGLPDSESIMSCWKNDTADTRLEFIYEFSAAVAGKEKRDAAYNSEKFYEEKGKDLINKIPEATWKCWGESADVKKLNENLKIDITQDEFHQKGAQFVHSHQEAFWKFQKIIKDNMEQHNFIHAGNAYGHMMQAIAATK